MKKPTLALVSTYKVECGIASYAEVIESELKNHFEARVFPLPPSYFKAPSGDAAKIADSIIDDICKELPKFDVVNLQLEPGIFGSNPKIIFKRLKKLINASPRVILTLHTICYKTSSSFTKDFIKTLLKRPRSIRNLISRNQWVNLFTKLFDFLQKTKPSSYYIIAHTKREADNIAATFGIKNIIDTPLSLLSRENIDAAINDSNSRVRLIRNYHLQDTDILIGVFGFITPYKGIETVIKALDFLPTNHKLMLFGAVHPNSIQPTQATNKYVLKLLKLTERFNAAERAGDRVMFCGKTTDKEFVEAMNACDFVILPYLETAQTSSGPTSMALELKKKIVTTNNHFFNEVAKYAKNCFLQFDIGNHLQLAQKIKYFPQDEIINQSLIDYNTQFNLEKRAIIYHQCWEKLSKIN
ncbi:MAG: glycosyltransferase [Gammaproteobacteria bacterium]